MTPLLTAARDRLAEKHREAVEERDRLEVVMDRAKESYRLQAVRVDAIAEALAELDKALAEAEPEEPVRRERMDIAAEVLACLADGPATTAALAARIGRKPSQITPALLRLRQAGRIEDVEDALDTYRLRMREAAE